MPRIARIAASLVLLLLVAACGGGHPHGIPKQFGDRKPVDWRGHVPSRYAVHGVDVSKYQGNIDWRALRAADVRFAFIKATEGGDVADPMFAQNWSGAAYAGIPRGAYHFYYFCRTAEEQAQWFMNHVPQQRGALPPILDVEWTNSRNCPRRPSPEWVRSEVATFLQIVGAYYGQKPIIYTTPDFFEDNQIWLLGDYHYWLRSVTKHPRERYAGQHWTFWQYTGTGRVNGVAGDIDLNAFEGGEAAWSDWLANHTQ